MGHRETSRPRWRTPLVGGLAAVGVGLAACALALSAQSRNAPDVQAAARLAGVAQGDYGRSAFLRILGRMDPAARAVASRHDPLSGQIDVRRLRGWESLDIAVAPSLGLRAVSAEDARTINALTQAARAPVTPAQPFVLRARSDAERARALRCLASAVYYESALEPLDGQRAVAQVVLNRVRDHNYPKSVCGVVWQGWERWTGCQFSFTCDGSLLRAPVAALWARSEQVAREALNGYVMAQVGTATHYHADYVLPYWSPTLVKIDQIGAHIFYRWTGPSGLPAAFTGRYSGNEFAISDAALTGRAPRAPRPTETLADGQMLEAGAPITGINDQLRAVRVVDPIDPSRVTTRYVARLSIGGRRPTTPEDVARINEGLRRYEAQAPATSPAAASVAPAAPTPGATELPVTEVNRPAA